MSEKISLEEINKAELLINELKFEEAEKLIKNFKEEFICKYCLEDGEEEEEE